MGLGICYEIGFSEGARFLALQGTQILIYPAAFGVARSYVWDLASRARAGSLSWRQIAMGGSF